MPLSTLASRCSFLVSVVALSACASPAATTAAPSSANSSARAPEYSKTDETWGKFHSKRFQLSVPLPDGKAWKIDDHSAPELVAMHSTTDSRLVLLATQEEELMNRQRCEERARKRSWFDARALGTVEDRVTVGPEAYDSRVWVAIDPAGPKGSIVGHVFLFGAFLRRCLLVHLTTAVPGREDEGVLASRLAIASARIVGGITLDPLRTTDDATVPRDKPPSERSPGPR